MTSKIKKSYYRLDFQIIICIIVIAATLFSFLSLAITVINSLKSNDEIITNIFALPKASLLGENIAFNFSHAWEAVKTSFISSIILSLIGAFFNCLLGSVLAYIFAYKDFYFKEFFFMMFLSVMLLPSIMGMPVLVPFVKNTLHLGETYIGYLLPNFAGGQVGALFLFRTFFCQQPKSIYESAQIEGANDFHIYLHIAIPLSWAIILFHRTFCVCEKLCASVLWGLLQKINFLLFQLGVLPVENLRCVRVFDTVSMLVWSTQELCHRKNCNCWHILLTIVDVQELL